MPRGGLWAVAGVEGFFVDSQIFVVRLVDHVERVAKQRDGADEGVNGDVGHHARDDYSRDPSLHGAEHDQHPDERPGDIAQAGYESYDAVQADRPAADRY